MQGDPLGVHFSGPGKRCWCSDLGCSQRSGQVRLDSVMLIEFQRDWIRDVKGKEELKPRILKF